MADDDDKGYDGDGNDDDAFSRLMKAKITHFLITFRQLIPI